MVVGIFGESCVGKSSFAQRLAEEAGFEIFTGKDYLRLAKNEGIARTLFRRKLEAAVTGENIIYVISEREHLQLLPEGAFRVLMAAELPLIKARFAQRMHGQLPPPVERMLEKKHGAFDAERHDIHIVSGETDVEAVVAQIMRIEEC